MAWWTPFLAASAAVKSAWLGSRLATWLGSFWVWKRWRGRQRLWWGLVLINLASLGSLVFLGAWLRGWRPGGILVH